MRSKSKMRREEAELSGKLRKEEITTGRVERELTKGRDGSGGAQNEVGKCLEEGAGGCGSY
jgi:hypothetical protein